MVATSFLTGSTGNSNTPLTLTPRPANEMYIETITIDQIPFTNKDGAGWDLTTGPDVYIELHDDKGGKLFHAEGDRREDITPKRLPLEWKFKTIVDLFGKKVGVRIGDFSGKHYFRIYDYDETGSDKIGYADFTVNELLKSNGLVKEYKIPNGNVTLRITVSWE